MLVNDADADAVPLVESVGDPDFDPDAVPLAVVVAEGDDAAEAELEELGESVTDGVPDPLVVPDSERVCEIVWDAEVVSEGLWVIVVLRDEV